MTHLRGDSVTGSREAVMVDDVVWCEDGRLLEAGSRQR